MIFVTVGTHHQPFPRLIAAISSLPASDLVVQHGHADPPAGVSDAVAFLPLPEFLEHIDAADVVVTHAGVGSILLARRAGHTPVVFPRRHAHGEHVDDHQVHLASALGDQGKVIPVWDDEGMAEAVARARPRCAQRPDSTTGGPLRRAVHEALRRGAR